MNMSFYELYVWLSEINFPSLFTIWAWLINVPWWLAIVTVMLVTFVVRMTWNMTFYFLNWFFDWTFRAGERFGEGLETFRKHLAGALQFGRLVKRKLFP